jgi:hypothetical protein
MYGAQSFLALIRELQGELDQVSAASPRRVASESWRMRVLDLAQRRIVAPHEFIDWAKRDRHWSFTLAEVMRESSSNPSELAARLFVAIVEELEDEREILAQEQLATAEAAPAAVAVYAE